MRKILGILIIVVLIFYVAFSLRHTYYKHQSHKNLEKLIIEKDSIIRQDSLQFIEYLHWSESYRERIDYAEKELENCQNKNN